MSINLDSYNDIDCALKVIPLVHSESTKIMDLQYKSWKELYILKLVYKLQNFY